MDPGSEGVLGQIYWDELCTVQARKSRGESRANRVRVSQRGLKVFPSPAADCQLPKAKPLTPMDIENDKVELTLNPHLKLARPSFDALLFLDDTSLRLNNTLPVSPAGSFWELIAHHPTIAHSFATSPPATVDPSPPSLFLSTPSPNSPCLFPLVPQDLLLFFGQTAVHNPDGISVWDARQALLRNPACVPLSSFSALLLAAHPFVSLVPRRLSSTRLSSTDSDKVVRGADTWLAGMLGPHVLVRLFSPFSSFDDESAPASTSFRSRPHTIAYFTLSPPTEQAYRLTRDGWEQEKPGSIRIGHASLFSIFSFDEEEEDDGE